ncbi:MAG: PKD domain-containing protein, partial [Candidatus Aminicenantes bacterium]|nr:PKD domain-containing protein [Candidatus Aminicenantes bacterium]
MEKKNRKKKRFSLIILLFCLLVGQEQLQAITNVSRSPQWPSWAPRIAVDFNGNVHVVWLELYSSTRGDIFYSFFDVTSRIWSVPFNVSSSGNVISESLWCADVATDSANRVYVTWIEGNRIKLKIKDGTWGGEFLVNSGGVAYESPRLGVSPEGDIFIIWWSHDGAVWSRARVGGVWEETRFISRSGYRSKFPDITVGRNIVGACWMERGPGEYWYQIAYAERSRTRNANWSKPLVVAPSDSDQQHGVVELDSLDRAHIVWTPEISEGIRQVYYASGTINGFTGVTPISSVDNLHYPSIAEAGGNIYPVWQLGSYGNGVGLFYNFRIGNTWRGETFFSGSGGATYCDIAVTLDQSSIYFVWDASGEIFVGSLAASPPPDNKPPVADFSFYPQKGEVPLTVTFDASLSYDPDGVIIEYLWDFGDGTFGLGKIVTHTYYHPGNYSVKLIVIDNKGATGTKVKIVEVIKRNQPPVADFTFSPITGLFPLDVTFDASASYDPDGVIVTYEWSFGDGATANGKIVKHRYSTWGVFNVKLIVYDDNGASATKTKSLEVLRLFQPLNIRWETHRDEGLFLTRYVTDIRWESNPKNDQVISITKIPLASYRVYRKLVGEDDRQFRFIGEVKANIFFFRDPNVCLLYTS